MKNVRRPTYLDRRAGAGIGRHMTRMVRAAEKAATDPKGAMEAMGLADAAAAKKAQARKALLLKKLSEKNK